MSLLQETIENDESIKNVSFKDDEISFNNIKNVCFVSCSFENVVFDTQFGSKVFDENALGCQTDQSDSALRIDKYRIGYACQVITPLRIHIGIGHDEFPARFEVL